MDKQGTQFYLNILLLDERHQNSHGKRSVASKQLAKLFRSQNPDNSPEPLAHFPFIPYPQYMSWAIMTSLNDIRIVCSPISAGKTLHRCRRAALTCLHTCQHPHQLFSTAMQEPCHHFLNQNSKPLTLSPRYFDAPSYWNIEFIIRIWYDMYSWLTCKQTR